jgi:hypothetical protein
VLLSCAAHNFPPDCFMFPVCFPMINLDLAVIDQTSRNRNDLRLTQFINSINHA